MTGTAPHLGGTRFRDRSWQRRQLPVLLSWLLGCALFAIVSLRAPGYASSYNLTSLVQQAGIVGIVGIGQTLVILTGGIDLSIPAIVSVAGVLLARNATTDFETWKILLVICGIAIVVGIVNGMIVGLLKAPAIIVTLGMGQVLTGALIISMQGGASIGSTGLRGVVPPILHDIATVPLVGPIPALGFIWLGLAVVVTFVLSLTSLGRCMYAIGNNPVAARMSGVNIPAVIVTIYVASALTAALGGVLLAGLLNQGYPDMGSPYLFVSITAVLVGGASILGGSGNYVGTVGGAFIVTILVGLLVILNLGQNWVKILYGVIIFGTVLAGQIVGEVSRHGGSGTVRRSDSGVSSDALARSDTPVVVDERI